MSRPIDEQPPAPEVEAPPQPADDARPVLEVDGLTVEYRGDGSPVRAVDDVSFTVSAGEIVALVGESGAGKSATALAVMGLLDAPPAGRIVAGDIRLRGRSLVGLADDEYRALRGTSLAMVFQDPTAALNPTMRVGDQVGEARLVHARAASMREARAGAVELLEQVGLADPGANARRYPHELSGGMRQRVVIAMALANDPDLLVADEPTTALDATSQRGVLDLLVSIVRDRRLGVLLVTHDVGVVEEVADRVVVMYAGRVAEQGPASDVLQAPRHPYTIGLLAAVPRLDGGKGRLRAVPGTAPDARNLPMGCAFHPRCDRQVEACVFQRPRLQVVGTDHSAACLRLDEELEAVKWP